MLARSLSCLLLLFIAFSSSGCFVYNRIGIALLYDEAKLPSEQVVQDIPYRTDAAADEEKHRLNLFLPDGEGWPTVVFIHGGGWTNGDKNLSVGGADVYSNIGRFFAAHGIGAVVINYRLLYDVDWPAQIEDAAQAVVWVQEHIGEYGGDAEALFLMGHSAGAQLASRLALDEDALAAYGHTPQEVCGVMAVSGAAYDLSDEQTYDLGGDKDYFRKRFGEADGWEEAASVVPFAHADAPPFLIIYAGGETKSLQRQSQVLAAALQEAGAQREVVIVPGESHERIVLALSRTDKTAGPAMLQFIEKAACTQ